MRVTRELPATVRIIVEEQVAVGMATLGDLYLVNADGEPFKKLESEDVLDLPLLTGVDRDTYVQDPRGTAARFRDGLALAHAYEASGAEKRARLSEVRLVREGRVVVTENGQEIRFADGPAEDALMRLFKVRSELSHRGLVAQTIYLDNRARPDRVTVKLKEIDVRVASASE